MSTSPSYVPPTYEDVQPQIEAKDTPQSHLLLVHIPAGFGKEQIGAKVEFDNERIRVFGERPLGKNRWIRFNQIYQVPANCAIDKIKGKFDGGIVTITMQKKVISGEDLKQELKPTEQEAPQPPIGSTEPKPENAQESVPPKSTTEVEQGKATASEVKDEKDQEGISKDPKSTVESKEQAVETLAPPEVTDKSMPQKDQEGISQDPKSTTETKEQADEALTTPKATELTEPQKGQEGIPQEATFTADAKHQTEEKFGGPSAEDGEKHRVEKEATEEWTEKTSESREPQEKESKGEERKESDIVPKSLVTKTPEKEKKREINGGLGDADGGSHRKAITESKGKRIKEVAASATQVVTSLARRFTEEDKQRLIYMGAAVVVVALGVYASYKFRSSPRL